MRSAQDLRDPEILGPPSRWLYLTEPARGALSINALPFALPFLTRAPRGDGHGVLVLPGLLATDTSTTPLRRFLGHLGYDVQGWQLGRNLGPTTEVLDGMRHAVPELAQSTGSSVSLVGWSLGGIYARELAREFPSLVRRVVALGSPFALTDARQSRAERAYRSQAHLHTLGPLPNRADVARPISVPSTAVYSRFDGIVAWQGCIEEPSATHENIEVRCAHLGFGIDPATLWAIADRLAQPEGSHTPFRASGALRWLYPEGR
jgi:pimeloyl-ACP methyl ester carboxylesterase